MKIPTTYEGLQQKLKNINKDKIKKKMVKAFITEEALRKLQNG